MRRSLACPLLAPLLVVTAVAAPARAQDALPPQPQAPTSVPTTPTPEPAAEPAPLDTAPVEPLTPEPAPTAAAEAPTDKPALRATYDKGVRLQSEDGGFELRLALRNQFRYEVIRLAESRTEIRSHLFVPRSRLQLEGHVFGTVTRYKVELGLGDRGSFSFVKDVYAERKLAAAPVWLRVGQWKRPFNRQELVSDFASELNERAITAEFVGGGRDLGVALHNDYEKSPEGLEWAVGVFNRLDGGADRPGIATECTGDPEADAIDCVTPAPANFPEDWQPALVMRAGWNAGGIKGYSEGDVEGGPLRYAIGASYKVDLADLDRGAQDSYADNLSHAVQADAMVKRGGLGAEVGVYLVKARTVDARIGALAQLGYLVIPKRAQIAGRFAWHEAAAGRDELEARAAFTWYWEGHAYKWSSDVGVLKTTGEDAAAMASEPAELQLRSMLQLTF